MARIGSVLYLLALFAAFLQLKGQFAIDHVGNFEDRVDGYRIQYHDEHNMLLLFSDQLSCFIADVIRGSSLYVKLELNETRIETQRRIIALIEQGHIAATTLDALMGKYHDALLRAFCYVAEVYTVDITSLETH